MCWKKKRFIWKIMEIKIMKNNMEIKKITEIRKLLPQRDSVVADRTWTLSHVVSFGLVVNSVENSVIWKVQYWKFQ